MSSGYLGVDGAVIEILGKIVVIGGRLESMSHDISEALSIPDPERKQFERLTEVIDKQVDKHGLPEWTRTDVASVHHWTQAARVAMRERNATMHGLLFSNGIGPLSMHFREGVMKPYEVDSFQAVLEKMEESERDGRNLLLDLLHEVKPQVYMFSKERKNGLPQVLIMYGSNPNFPRPTQDDIDAYWESFNARSLSRLYPAQ